MKLRIVKDMFAGYEVQRWSWWWPFWVECGDLNGICNVNTHSSIEEAEAFAAAYRKGRISKVVKEGL